MIFEWDEAKRQSNIEKHGIDFVDILPAFQARDRLIFRDNRGNHTEDRYILFAPIKGRLCCAVYTIRNDTIRLITARKCNDREVKHYEQKKNDQSSADR